MMELLYRKMQLSDIPVYVEMRLSQLKEEGAKVNCDLKTALYDYYNEYIPKGEFIAFLAEFDGEIIATSGLTFIVRPPYYNNPTGKTGILSSMYTKKEFRRQGIAKKLLELLINEAKNYGCGQIIITGSDMGVKLYDDFGFKQNLNFRYLNI